MNFNNSHTQETLGKSDQGTSQSNHLKLAIRESLKIRGESYITYRGTKIG